MAPTDELWHEEKCSSDPKHSARKSRSRSNSRAGLSKKASAFGSSFTNRLRDPTSRLHLGLSAGKQKQAIYQQTQKLLLIFEFCVFSICR
jgi:hypothetical protein